MKINIISTNNGVGLYQDYLILQEILSEKHEVNFIDFRRPVHIRADVSIHLEVVESRLLATAPKNILVPNPEWFSPNWKRFIPSFNQIWCKTHETERIFGQMSKNCVYTSFTSRDHYLPEISKDKIFFHNRGKSSHKGTNAVLTAWRDLFGKMYINSFIKLPGKKGLIINTTRLSENDLKVIMNSCLFHVCPSEVEGFGHYINEAKSTGAIVLTTNAAPMNELVSKEFGRLVPITRTGVHNLGVTNYISPMELTLIMNDILHLSEKELSLMSGKARQSYLDNDKYFRNKVRELTNV